MSESFPQSPHLTSDPAWQVYRFQRDGIEYLQINDSAGVVRAAVGQIEQTHWVLPIGRDADRVTIAAQSVAASQGRIVYRDDQIEIIQYQHTNQDRWIIRSLKPSR